MGKDKRKPLVELSEPGGSIIMYWPSAKQAASYYGMNQVIISYNANGVTHQAKGHYFRFATTEEINKFNELQENLKSPDNPPALENTQPIIIDIPADHIETPKEEKINDGSGVSYFDQILQKNKEKLFGNSE